MCSAISRLLSRWKASSARPITAIGPLDRETAGVSSGALDARPVNGLADAGAPGATPISSRRASRQRQSKGVMFSWSHSSV
jgi:hypothetical protein